MASRQNLGSRRGRMYGYGGGPLASAYGGPANYVNPKMTEWRAQQASSKGVNRADATQRRIAQAQQTGVGRGTQEQIVRSSTPGGGGYNRAEAMARERQLASRPVAEQMAMLGRRANPRAGQPGAEKFDSGLEGKSLEGAINGGGPLKKEWKSEWTPERRQRWKEDQEDLKNPFGPRMRKGEEGKWSPEQKAAWRRGETPRQQMAGITGGEAGMQRARDRMAANTGRERQAAAAETPWAVEKREWQEAEQAKKEAAARAKPAVQPPMRQAGGGRRSIWGRAFSGSKLGGRGGFMSQAIQRAQAQAKKGGQTGFGFGNVRRSPGSKGAISNSGYDPKRIKGFGGSGRRGQRRTGGIGGASKTGGSIRSRGLRGRGMGGTL